MLIPACFVLVALIVFVFDEIARHRRARGVIEPYKRDRGERR